MSIRTVQERLKAAGYDPGPIDGLWGKRTSDALDAALAVPLIPDDYWPMLSKIESGDRPYVKAQTSSASGLYQFIKATWEGEGGRWGIELDEAFGGLKPTPEEQLARATTFTAKNAAALQAAGLPINKASLYAAHFLGAPGAIRIIQADVNTPLRQVAGAAQRTANPSILGGERTVADFLTWLHRKTGEWAR